MMPYSALLGGYYPFTRPTFDPGKRPGSKPEAPSSPPPAADAPSGYASLYPPERGSTAAETADWYANTAGEPRPNDLAGQNVISSEPGMMSIMGLSTGSAYDELGRAYDTMNFDAGNAVGGLLGNLVAGPLGGLAVGLLGRQADFNYPLTGTRARGRDFGQGIKGMSSGEQRAFEEARDAVMNRPKAQVPFAPTGSRGSEVMGADIAAGRQAVSGATRGPSGMGSRGGVEHRGYGDRGRWL